ncbi:hypothetical protein M409DRAFT_26918 [Zasmidium cellare ATCC 36951]|uniref:Uncharacterized protein n=1 Tax=Zasmidium cellare ATCC 36951 TaxID=1080233 RepID=A0A6A6C6K2_ZASCE|nr:uncharacterized protein M409DRAFT_26918 [Zasmidium cellare ATCC 36951]KAF2162681.1 hypothetical protein M409DRAFT_26918 [Zasmidium cellare ATCC 36951]
MGDLINRDNATKMDADNNTHDLLNMGGLSKINKLINSNKSTDTDGVAVMDGGAGDDTLTARIHGLPPELFEIIYNFVFTMPRPTRREVHIDADYKPPVQLQISSATRASLAGNYYSSSIFAYDENDGYPLFVKFIMSLPWKHRAMIRIQHTFRYSCGVQGHACSAATSCARRTSCIKANWYRGFRAQLWAGLECLCYNETKQS